jgi:hypothetical protein
MSTVSAPAPAAGPAGLLSWTVVLALLGGALLDILALLVAEAGPSGDGWSLRGNGALVVPLGVGPAVLGGGWTALALHAGRRPQWAVLGVAAGLVGAVLALAQVAYLALIGQSGAGVFGAFCLGALLVWVVAAPAAAALGARGGSDRPGWHLVAAAALLLGLVVGYAAMSRVLPPG